jgi:hypothetical protein
MTKAKPMVKTKVTEKGKAGKRHAQRAKQPPQGRVDGGPGRDPEILARPEFWQEQIDNLIGRPFKSVDEAIEAVVTEVLNALSPGAEHSAEEREMLHTMLATDPEFAEDLEIALDIRKH